MSRVVSMTEGGIRALLLRALAGEGVDALAREAVASRMPRNRGARVAVSLRAAVWLREGGLCMWCGADLTSAGLDLDHLGDRRDSRLQAMVASCPGCNGARARMSWAAFAVTRDGAYLTRWGGEPPNVLIRYLGIHADANGSALRADGLRLSRGTHELSGRFSASRCAGGTGARESRPGNRPSGGTSE